MHQIMMHSEVLLVGVSFCLRGSVSLLLIQHALFVQRPSLILLTWEGSPENADNSIFS